MVSKFLCYCFSDRFYQYPRAFVSPHEDSCLQAGSYSVKVVVTSMPDDFMVMFTNFYAQKTTVTWPLRHAWRRTRFFQNCLLCVQLHKVFNPCYTRASHPSQVHSFSSLVSTMNREMKTLSLRMWDISLYLNYADYPEFMLKNL